jgi:hypothetical protein
MILGTFDIDLASAELATRKLGRFNGPRRGTPLLSRVVLLALPTDDHAHDHRRDGKGEEKGDEGFHRLAPEVHALEIRLFRLGVLMFKCSVGVVRHSVFEEFEIVSESTQPDSRR